MTTSKPKTKPEGRHARMKRAWKAAELIADKVFPGLEEDEVPGYTDGGVVMSPAHLVEFIAWIENAVPSQVDSLDEHLRHLSKEQL